MSDSEEGMELHTMWEFFDIPLDVPLTSEDVQKYRRDRRLQDDLSVRRYQSKMFNKEFYAMAEQFPPGSMRQPVIFFPPKELPSGFQLKRAKILSSICLTAKRPLSQGYFETLPTVIHEKILTFLTGLGDLHTRALWLSMRSELNKYDRAYMRNASLPRAEASFLDRLSMNLFEQLKSRRNRSQINREKVVSFEEWRKEFIEINRLKKERRQAIIRSMKSEQEMLNCVDMEDEKGPLMDHQFGVGRQNKETPCEELMELVKMEEKRVLW